MRIQAQGLSLELCILLVAASAERTHWTQRHMVDPWTYNLPKMIFFKRPDLGSTTISTGPGKIPYLKIAIEFKGILVFFPSILNAFTTSTNRKNIIKNGVRRKRSHIQTTEFLNNNIRISNNVLCDSYILTNIKLSYRIYTPMFSNMSARTTWDRNFWKNTLPNSLVLEINIVRRKNKLNCIENLIE